VTHDNHPHDVSPYDRHSSPGDTFGLAGCTSLAAPHEPGEAIVGPLAWRAVFDESYDDYSHGD
jgi:hypothetical protein